MKTNLKFLIKLGLLLGLCGIFAICTLPKPIIDFYFETVDTERLGESDTPFCDFNENGTHDAADILAGAKLDAANMPEYDGSYHENGYPPDDIGVCTDVVWRAFRTAGYSLRRMVDLDVKNRPEAYPNISEPDDNIDFRRVVNLRVFFEAHAISLTTDPGDTDQWQAGDIVVFRDKNGRPCHVGIISDKRTDDGRAYLIHNSGQAEREEDVLLNMPIAGHYRFDASRVDSSLLIPWGEADEKDLPVKG
jgi:uncharacterized protein YijF (DUF1287 family)